MINSQSNSNNDMVNLFNSRLKECNINGKMNHAREKLDQWRNDCYKTIDELYQRKSVDLDNYIKETKTKYEEKKDRVQTIVNQLNDQQKMDEENIRSAISSIERDLCDLEKTSIRFNIRPLIIDDSYVYFEKEFSFRNISPNFSEFSYSDNSSSAIASSDRFLLMHQNLNLCLIDQDSKIVKQSPWTQGWIRDMCWSSTLYRFIVITENNIYSVDENLQLCSLLKEPVMKVWFSCTCSDKSLYLSTCEWGSSIFETNLLSPIDVIAHWTSPLTCALDEGINDIKYNNGTLALMIKDVGEHKKRMELKSAKTFETIWLFHLSTASNIRLFTCCPLNNNEWLVIDGTNSQIYLITNDGKTKEDIHYNSIPYRANLFGSNILAVSAEYNLTLHKI